jgi:hypothetical protein
MTKRQKLQLFEDKKVRTVWDVEQEKWYFNCGCAMVLTEVYPPAYRRKLKAKIKRRRK